MSPNISSSDPEHDQQLLNQAIHKLFLDRPDLIAPEQTAIQSILQGNLESGRISRRFNEHPADQIEGFLAAYVAVVAYYYTQENPRLLSLHAGSPQAWSQLTDWLVRCAYVKLRRIGDGLTDLRADDFAQETSLWLLEEMSPIKWTAQADEYSPAIGQAIRYHFDVPFQDWIAKVQSNHVIDTIRWLYKHPNSIGAEIESLASEDDIEDVLERITLTQEISRLTQRQREVVARLYKGMDIDDISQQLDCTGRAVYNRKYAALNHLRRQLKQE